MVAANPNLGIASQGFDRLLPAHRSADRARPYLEKHPEVSREEFMLEAVRWSAGRSPLSAKDIQLHAWLTERLAVLHYDRYGLWPRLRRLLTAVTSRRRSSRVS